MTMEQVVTQRFNKSYSHSELKLPQIWTCGRSASDQQSRDSSSSESHSESHRVKRSWSSKGVLWQRRGFSTVVEEDGGILRWRDQGV